MKARGVLFSIAVVVSVLVGSATPISASASPTVRITLNGSEFSAGNTLTIGLEAQNPSENPSTDLYIGVLLPGGETAVLFSAPGILGGAFSFANPASFPRVQGVPPGLALNVPSFFEFRFPVTGIPPGSYQVFAALIRQGALGDKQATRLDPRDIVAFSSSPFTFIDRLFSQPNAIYDGEGRPVVVGPDRVSADPVFRPGEKNLLIIHGFNDSPFSDCMRELVRMVRDLGANVLVYQYPSGQPIGGNAQWLENNLWPLLANPNMRFDIIGYSEGGLVARAAKEPGAFNGYRGFGNKVENLVTIATPHDGILNRLALLYATFEATLYSGPEGPTIPGVGVPETPTIPAVEDMLQNSDFLRSLNSGRPEDRQGRTRYTTIAGRVDGRNNDGVVAVGSAHGERGLNPRHDTIDVNLGHNRPTRNDRGMPCDEQVYAAIRAILFTAPAPGPGSLPLAIWGLSLHVGRLNSDVRDNLGMIARLPWRGGTITDRRRPTQEDTLTVVGRSVVVNFTGGFSGGGSADGPGPFSSCVGSGSGSAIITLERGFTHTRPVARGTIRGQAHCTYQSLPGFPPPPPDFDDELAGAFVLDFLCPDHSSRSPGMLTFVSGCAYSPQWFVASGTICLDESDPHYLDPRIRGVWCF